MKEIWGVTDTPRFNSVVCKINLVDTHVDSYIEGMTNLLAWL